MKKTKWIALILTAALMCSLYCSLTVSAAERGSCGENLIWTLSNNGELLISGTGEMYDYTNGRLVPWYYYRETIKKVELFDGVTSIGVYAFAGCPALSSVTIPDSVISIHNSAFWNCTALTSIEIPSGVRRIGEFVFFDCRSLEHVTIPASVKSIGVRAFYGCSVLTGITISNGVESIGGDAFYGCSALTSIEIPASITTIGDGAFSYCSALERIQVNENNPKYASDGGALYNKDKTQLLCYPAGKSEVELFDGVTGIADKAFMSCSRLMEIEIPESVTSIGDRAFSGCSALASITLPDGVTSIGNFAFESCSALTSVTLPASVTNFGDRVFGYCRALESIQFDENNPAYTSVGGLLYNKDKTQLLCCPAGKDEAEILNGVTSIADYAFYGCKSLTNITLPDGVTNIGNGAFEDCGALGGITLPDSLTSIGDYAFNRCYMLWNITIPAGVTSIGQSAFSWCYALRSITLPASVTSIGDYAFYLCSALGSVTIPASVTSIGSNAFKDCNALTIYGFSGSYAQEYANENVIPFVAGTMIGDRFFSDVVPGEWYVSAVQYAVDHELFRGVSETEFAPQTAMTRAMLVTVLWRMEGQPMGNGEALFIDVPSDEWYSEAVLWASSNDIVEGIGDGRFDPKGDITREQVATILYRYSQQKGYDVSNSGELTDFPDGANVSDYAANALSWAYGEELMTGVRVGEIGYLDPQGSATRAQVATILMRYQTGVAQ